MELPWWATFVCGGAAASIAEIVTLPIDTAKVRLQLLRKTSGGVVPGAPGGGVSLGMVGMMRKIVLDEGVLGLYKGVWPAIQRQLVFASLRVGIYKEISDRLREPNQAVTLERKILAGLLSGAIGIT
jgi:solute carrier family 25 uncoupling protein 8/9